jgi:hypothetical protein
MRHKKSPAKWRDNPIVYVENQLKIVRWVNIWNKQKHLEEQKTFVFIWLALFSDFRRMVYR